MMSWFSRAMRRARSDDGFSVIETLVALSVLAIALVGIAQIASSSLVQTLRNRERETAIGVANRTIEEVKSNGYGNVKMVDGPTTYTDSTGTYNTLRDTACTTCLTHSVSTTENSFPFTVKTWVVAIDDSDDGVGGADADALTVDYKRVIVQVGAVNHTTVTYTVDTLIHDTADDPAVAVQGLSLEIHDETGAILGDPAYTFHLDIPGVGVAGAEVEEGIYNNFSMAPGTYTCTLSNISGISDSYHPVSNPTANSESFSCSVTPGNITTVVRTWSAADACPATGSRQNLWVKVTDSNGANLSGASVNPAPADGQIEDPAVASTAANGEVTFSNVLIGDYTLDVSKTGYVTQTGLNVCVHSGLPTQPQLTVSLNPDIVGANVQVTFKSTATGTVTWKLVLENGPQPYEQQLAVSKDQTATFTLVPVAYGTYHVRLYCLKNGAWDKRKEDKDEVFSVPAPPYTYNFGSVGC
jgi:prepilin-type N-terminal cleavage/methylation domain-containing protein